LAMLRLDRRLAGTSAMRRCRQGAQAILQM
jgi:hypothetical protein